MTLHDKEMTTDRLLLRAAQVAVEQGDLSRADVLFREHLAQWRDDPVGLADYGNFCLRTGRPEPACYLLYKASKLIPGNADLLSELGHARLEANDPEGARRSFEEALALDPGSATANYGIALCHQQTRAWPEAAAAFERALATQPDTMPILLNLADAYHRSGDTAKAAIRFEQTERLAPDDPALLLEYGKFLRDTGSFALAMQKLDRCAREHPDEPPVLLETARCMQAMGEHQRAMQMLGHLNKLSPDMPECLVEYGNCLASMGNNDERDRHWGVACSLWIDAKQYDSAGPLLDKMLAVNPANASAWNSKGLFHDFQLDLEPAEAAFLQAIKVDHDLLDPYVNLGNLYEHSNRLAEASAMADTGLRLAGERLGEPHIAVPGLHLLRAKIARREKQYALGLQHLDAMVGLTKSDLVEQTELFERAKLLDLLDETDAAVAAFNRANALARAELGEEEDAKGNKFLRGVEYMIDLAGKGWLRTWRKPAPDPAGPAPAFLVGFPRSGTTLLNTVLYSHSAIQVIEEKQTIAKILGATRQMPKSYPHAMPECDAIDVAYMREAYYRAAAEYCDLDPAKLLVDKFPMHLATAGLIHLAFPRARFLFALRHPCDAVLSCFMQNFQLNDAMANFCTIGDTVRLYAKTMDLWQAYREQLPLTVHTIRYEDVVDDFDGQVRALCDFLQVPWEDGLRQFSTRALDRGRINTPSYEQVSKPIYRDARYRWERYREHLAPFLPALQPYIDRFGYSDPV
jgi:tetratricopeptide (TPR) repeat protein